MLHHDPAILKQKLYEGLHALAAGEADAATLYAPQALYFGNHPLNELAGPAAIESKAWQPIRQAFRQRSRVDSIFTGGSFGGADWISATGYLHGVFAEPYLGVPPTGNWAYLRYGEFHKVEYGRITRSHVIFDIPDLMRQAGVFPWRPGIGVETLQPGPASGDGMVLGASDPAETKQSLDLVEAMIFEGLLEPAGDVSTVDQMRQYWTDDMMWYGPALIGATRGIENFYRYHEDAWERAVKPRGPKPTREKKHVTRFADGAFCSFTGWPSIYATIDGVFLGLTKMDCPVEIRVMDFYHRRGHLLDENWIFIDFPHLFLQLGIDLFARMEAIRDKRPVEQAWVEETLG